MGPALFYCIGQWLSCVAGRAFMHAAAGRGLRRRGVRRDEGIPPYGRFIGSAYTGKAACFRREERHVGADSISAWGVRGGAGRADMESAPTGGCSTAGFALSRLGAGPPLVRRGGIYPSRGRLRQRGVRRDEGIPPYGRFIGFAYTGKAACSRREERHVGADSISARGVRGSAGLRDDASIVPYRGLSSRRVCAFPVGRVPAVGS